MTQSSPPAAGGILLTVGTLGGAAIGFALGQPTAGLLVGLAGGAAIATLLWWRTRG